MGEGHGHGGLATGTLGDRHGQNLSWDPHAKFHPSLATWLRAHHDLSFLGGISLYEMIVVVDGICLFQELYLSERRKR